MALPRDDLGRGTSVNVRVGGSVDDLASAMAAEMAALIRAGESARRPVCAIVPVGPVGQYEILARTIAREGLDCSRVTFINMDEFLDEDDEETGWIDPGHPLSFRGF